MRRFRGEGPSACRVVGIAEPRSRYREKGKPPRRVSWAFTIRARLGERQRHPPQLLPAALAVGQHHRPPGRPHIRRFGGTRPGIEQPPPSPRMNIPRPRSRVGGHRRNLSRLPIRESARPFAFRVDHCVGRSLSKKTRGHSARWQSNSRRLGSVRQFRGPLEWAFIPPELRASRRNQDRREACDAVAKTTVC
jgi:hypothetical protein